MMAGLYITADELVARWRGGICKGTLANWRAASPRKGPAFVKIGGRVLYPLDGVAEFEAKNMHAMNENENGELKK